MKNNISSCCLARWDASHVRVVHEGVSHLLPSEEGLVRVVHEGVSHLLPSEEGLIRVVHEGVSHQSAVLSLNLECLTGRSTQPSAGGSVLHNLERHRVHSTHYVALYIKQIGIALCILVTQCCY